MKISEFKTDHQAEEHGIWQDAGVGNLRLKVARLPNRRYRAFLLKHGGKLRRMAAQITDTTMEQIDATDDLVIRAMAHTVLVDWDNLEDDNGDPLPFSIQNAEQTLRDVPDFRRLVEVIARDMGTFQSQNEEHDLGN
jgi:hypothetical protein